MATAVSTPTLQPNFAGMVRGEFLKITRQRAIWITGGSIAALGVLLGFVFIPIINSFYSVRVEAPGSTGQPPIITQLHPDAGSVAYQVMQQNFSIIVRPLSGIFIMVAAVIVIALEYQQGTIRVLLSRGIGRIQLLGAKVVALLVTGLIGVAVLFVIGNIMAVVALGLSGHSDVLGHLPGFYWSDVGTYLLATVINLVATAGLAITFAVLGRSLAFGLGFTMPFFFVESILGTILTIITAATSDAKWYGATKFFLGTNLTQLGTLLTPTRYTDITGGRGVTSGALFDLGITGNQALLVTLAYVVVFVAASGLVTARRDVLQ